jgi:hypothetical protein
MVFNQVLFAMLVTIIDTKFRFCTIVTVLCGVYCLLFIVLEAPRLRDQLVRLWAQISNRITGGADPDDISDGEDSKFTRNIGV